MAQVQRPPHPRGDGVHRWHRRVPPCAPPHPRGQSDGAGGGGGGHRIFHLRPADAHWAHRRRGALRHCATALLYHCALVSLCRAYHLRAADGRRASW
eukprot:367667-Prorocentrum_minimum.AAC.1